MKKFIKVAMVIMVSVAAIMLFAGKVTFDKDGLLNKVFKTVEAVETEEENTKELVAVLQMRKSGSFVCYEVMFTDGTYDEVSNLEELVTCLNDNLKDMFVQTETGKIQRVDVTSKTVGDLTIATATLV